MKEEFDVHNKVCRKIIFKMTIHLTRYAAMCINFSTIFKKGVKSMQQIGWSYNEAILIGRGLPRLMCAPKLNILKTKWNQRKFAAQKNDVISALCVSRTIHDPNQWQVHRDRVKLRSA
jgi:hypothetical protein